MEGRRHHNPKISNLITNLFSLDFKERVSALVKPDLNLENRHCAWQNGKKKYSEINLTQLDHVG